MADYLILDTTLAAIGNAIRAKEGSSALIPVSEIASRIAAIETGATGAAVQRKSGTITTGSFRNDTVTCGFKPDLVVLHRSEGSTNNAFSCAAAFAEDTRKSKFALALWSNEISMYQLIVSRSDTGFSIYMEGYNDNWDDATTETTFSYIAVKYT